MKKVMENKSTIITADSVSEAIKIGSRELGVSPDMVSYEILEEGKKGLFKGMSKFFRVKVSKGNKQISQRDDSVISDIIDYASHSDGFFKLEYQDGFATLTVYPPEGEGKPVYVDDVANRMKLLGIPRVSIFTLEQIITEAKGVPVKLIKWPEGAELGATIKISTSDDKMMATAYLTPPQKGGAQMTKNQVMHILYDMKITYGIDEIAIDKLISKPLYNENVVIAKGKIPIHGSGATIKYHFNTHPGKPFLEDEQGRVDLKELDFVQNKTAGQLLAEKLPPIRGVPGYNIHGEEIKPRPGPDQILIPGKNTYFDEKEQKLFAAIDGNVYKRNKTVNVEPMIVLDDVDYEVGNIDFNGSVHIRGSIADGFKVMAQGFIQVDNFVGKAYIKAGKEVILKAGMNGGGEGIIEAEDNIYARFIESARIITGCDLLIEEAIMHSIIQVKGNLIFSGRRGELIGGENTIGGCLWCKKLGSINGVKTQVSMGIDPEKISLYNQLREKINDRKDKLAEIEIKIKRLEKIATNHQGLPHELEAAFSKLIKMQKRLRDEIQYLDRESTDISFNLVPSKESIAVIEDTGYEGAVVHFGREEFRVPPNDIRKTVLKYIGGKIKESGFNPLHPPSIQFDCKQEADEE